MPVVAAIRRSAKRTIALPAVSSVVMRAAAARGHALGLMYHRVADRGPAPHEVVPTVPTETFRAQLERLRDLATVVPATQLVHARRTLDRPMVALTFDDDYRDHLRTAELLVELGLPATFFLSGRALHGSLAYWWEVLERRIERDGLAGVTRALGFGDADGITSIATLAAACEVAPPPALAEPVRTGDHLEPADIASLASLPGISIGFHTVQHRVLPTLSPGELADAVRMGRVELERACGRPVDTIAYPHGKANLAVADAARAAGFRHGWTGRPEPITGRSDPLLLGRWEPHDLPVDRFAAQLAIRLHRGDPALRRSRQRPSAGSADPIASRTIA